MSVLNSRSKWLSPSKILKLKNRLGPAIQQIRNARVICKGVGPAIQQIRNARVICKGGTCSADDKGGSCGCKGKGGGCKCGRKCSCGRGHSCGCGCGLCGKSQSLKVTVIGGVGRVGKALCLMLKQSPFIDQLCIYDLNDTCEFASELAHIDTRCTVSAYTGVEHLKDALNGSKIVVLACAGINTSSMSYDAMFKPNAMIVHTVVDNIARVCPKAFIAVATHPLNSMLPVACETLRHHGVFNPKTLFGVTTMNIVRANTLIAEALDLEPECVSVPVIGGSTNETIVPLLSRAKPSANFTDKELEQITQDLQNAYLNTLKSKHATSAGYACAFAIARFIISLIKGMKRYRNIIDYAYVRCICHRDVNYLATPIELGPGGIIKNYGIPPLSEYEGCLLSNAIMQLSEDIKKGDKFAKKAILKTGEKD